MSHDAYPGAEYPHAVDDQEAFLEDLNSRRDRFLTEVKELHPPMAELADIEEQVIKVTQADPSDTARFEVLRDYTKAERAIIRKDLRANRAAKDADYIFSPFVPTELQTDLAETYKKYAQGRLSQGRLNTALEPALPYMLTTKAFADPEGGCDPEMLLAQAQSDPKKYLAWQNFGTLNRIEIAAGLGNDGSDDISPSTYKSIEGIAVQITWFDVGLQPRQRRVDELEVWNDHRVAMNQLRDEGYPIYPTESDKSFDFFNSDSRPRPQYRPENLDRNFKFHLMPKLGEIAITARKLADMINSEPEFAASIDEFKVRQRPESDDKLGDYPTPEIVIYSRPTPTEQSLATALRYLNNAFGDHPGRAITPRMNVPVGSGGMLYMAEGHGYDKVRQHIYHHDLDLTYNPDQNYAFRHEDETLIARIFALAKIQP